MRLPCRKKSVQIKYVNRATLPIIFLFNVAQFAIIFFPIEMHDVFNAANEGKDFRKTLDNIRVHGMLAAFTLFIGAIITSTAITKTLMEDITHECGHHERLLEKHFEETNQIDKNIRHQSTGAIISKTINNIYKYHFDRLRQCKSRDELNFKRYSRSHKNSHLLSTLILTGILLGTFCILPQTYNIDWSNEWIKDKQTMYIELSKQLLTAIAFVALTYPCFEVRDQLWQRSEQLERLEQSSEKGEIVGITPHS